MAHLISWLLAAVFLSSPPAFAGKPKVKNLECGSQPTAGTRGLCQTIEAELEWQWMGHAVPAPGYAAGQKTVRDTYCKHPITMASVDDLVALALGPAKGPAGILAETAEELLQLLGPEVLKHMPDPEKEPDLRRKAGLIDLKRRLEMSFERRGTVFTQTDSADYVLKDGCRGVKGAKISG